MGEERAGTTSEESRARDAGLFLAGALVGGLVGAGVALLYAPHSGRRTRGKIRRRAEDLAEQAEEKVERAREDARRAAEDVRRAAERSGDRISEGVKRGVEEGRRRMGE